MNTPRTDKARREANDIEDIFPLVDEARKLELEAMTKDRDKWTELAAKYAREREYNAIMALAYKADLKAEREKVAKLRRCISELLEGIEITMKHKEGLTQKAR